MICALFIESRVDGVRSDQHCKTLRPHELANTAVQRRSERGKRADLVWGDDELEVEQVVLVGEHNLTRLWQVQLIDV